MEKNTNAREVFPGMTSEEIKAIFFDDTALKEPSYRVYQLNSDGHRYYYRFNAAGEPEFYPSVTTLLKQVMPTPPQLLDWMIANGKEGSTEKRDLAAAYGTFMHIQFESLLINRRYDFDSVPAVLMNYIERENLPDKVFGDWVIKIRKDVLAFAQFVRDYNIKPLAIEIGLVHPDYHYAGCIDMPCIMTDPKSGQTFSAIVDFKSGRKAFYEEHELQLHLYKAMWETNFSERPIERLFNFSPKDWRTKPTYNLKDQTDSVNASKLPYLLALAAIEDDKRDNTMVIVRGVLELDKGKIADNLLTLSLSELIKQKAASNDAPEPDTDPDKPLFPDTPEEKAPESQEPAQKRPKSSRTTKDTSKTEKAAESPNVDKLPWEKDMQDGTGIEVKKTDDGVEVTAKVYEVTKKATNESLLNDEVEL